MSYTTNYFDDKIIDLLTNGGVGLMPTDTIYGLSCRALDKAAVEKIHWLKGRDSGKPLIVLISDVKMLDLLAPSQNLSRAVGNQITEHQAFGAGLSREIKEIIDVYWPGALSIEFYLPNSPDWLHRGLNHFAIRVPDFPELLELINNVGPLVSTSANTQGQEPAHSVADAKAVFSDKLDFYVDNGLLDNLPSTLAVVKNNKLEVVRPGAVKISPAKTFHHNMDHSSEKCK